MSKPRNIFVRSLPCLIAVLAAVLAPASAGAQDAAGAPTGEQPPVAYASVSELNGILSQLQQTVQSMQSDLGKTRIERWKTAASTKKQTLANVESIQRNLQSALPETIAQLNNAPEDLGTSFKLYRNLDALYDVFGSVVESAGAFGSKDEFQSLGNDMNGLESARRSFGERMQKLTASKEEELTRLRAQVKTLSAAPPPPPKRIIVDDTEPPKKPAKKKSTKPKAPAPTTDAPPGASPTK
jgi:TolA-binding protein